MIEAAIPYIQGFWPDIIFACLCLWIGIVLGFGNPNVKKEKRNLVRKLGFGMLAIGVILVIFALTEYRKSN
ncbi:MAG TPA: hypothetical protein VMH87_13720 [Pseudomonadales bacterium]|nr:hypothetical protein [Pseudomonadales bacterium]